jgi:hypothetical protein
VVPKAQRLVSLFSQKITSRFVLFHFGSVLLAVKFDYQSIFETAEIGNKRTDSERGSQTRPLGSAALRLDRPLPPELGAGQPSCTQSRPRDDEQLLKLMAETPKADFLFGPEIKDYIEIVWQRAMRLF